MAEPTCKECGGHNFDSKNIDNSNARFIIYCKDCGWIAGCGGV